MSSSPRKICITGATAGIGLAVAKLLAKDGHRLFLGARRTERLDELAQEIASFADSVTTKKLDVRDSDSVAEFASDVGEWSGGELDCLVNNAGLALGLATVEEGDPEHWRQMFETNVLGLLYMTRGCLPFLKQGTPGHVINIGSIAGHQVYEKGAAYCGTKHAVDAITRTLKLELNSTGVRVTTIDPGMVETEFSLVRLGNQADADAVYKGLTPLSGEDIAHCVRFALDRPAHVNIDEMIVMPTDQASATKSFRRE